MSGLFSLTCLLTHVIPSLSCLRSHIIPHHPWLHASLLGCLVACLAGRLPECLPLWQPWWLAVQPAGSFAEHSIGRQTRANVAPTLYDAVPSTTARRAHSQRLRAIADASVAGPPAQALEPCAEPARGPRAAPPGLRHPAWRWGVRPRLDGPGFAASPLGHLTRDCRIANSWESTGERCEWKEAIRKV